MPTLAAALATVAVREPWLQVVVGEPVGDGWTRADALLDPAALDRLVAAAAARLGREHPRALPGVRRTVAAAVLLDHWAWALAVVGAGTLAASGRVPDLAPERVHLRLDEGEVTGVAVGLRPGAEGEAGLRTELRGHLARLHALLTEGPAPLLRRSARLLQGGIGDAVATALATQGRDLPTPERERLRALGDRLLVEAGTWGAPGWLVVDGAGPQELRTRRRTTCCLWYRLPEQGPCLTCPRLTDEARAARLRADAVAVP